MSIRDQIAALRTEAKAIMDAEGDGLSAEKYAVVEAKLAEAASLKEQLELGVKAAQQLDALASGDGSDFDEDEARAAKGGPLERFINSDAYRAFKQKFPSGAGQGSNVHIEKTGIGSLKDFMVHRKALLTSTVAQAQPQEFPLVDLVDRPQLSLLDLISRGRMTGDAIRYVQIQSVTRNADIVPEATSDTDAAALKPTSDLVTGTELAEAFTYADGYTVTNQMLSDNGAFATFMDQELRYSLPATVERYLLNGAGTAGEPRGILNTTGVQQQTYASGGDAMAKVKAVRQAITKVVRLRGGTVQAIVLSPEDDEAIDLMQDTQNRFFGQGPFGQGPTTLWGRPRVISEAVEPGTFVLGDFRQVALLDREGLAIEVFNQHKDYAQRNLSYVRAELRAAQAIWRPSRLAVVTAAGA